MKRVGWFAFVVGVAVWASVPASALTNVPSTNTLAHVSAFSAASVSVDGTYVPGTTGNPAAYCIGSGRSVTVSAKRTTTPFTVFSGTSTGTTDGSNAYSFSANWNTSLPTNKTFDVTTTVAGQISGGYGGTYVCTDATSNVIQKST